MKLILFGTAAALVLASPATAQMNMPGMVMPTKPAKAPVAKAEPSATPTKRRAPSARKKAKPAPIVAPAHHPATSARQPVTDKSMANMPGMNMTPAAPQSAPAGQTTPAPTSGHDMSTMPGMDMGTQSAPASTDPHAGHDMSGTAEIPGMDTGTQSAPATTDSHEGHDMSGMAGMQGMEAPDDAIGNSPAPAPPTDHAADAIFGTEQMAPTRIMLRHENGGMPAYSVIFNLAEYRVQKGGNAYHWDGEGWFGGDIDRFVVKSEGEGAVRGGVGSAEVQALYSRAIGPWFNFQAGVRHDFKPGPARTYATVGFEGIVPYWFDVEGALFLSDKGDVLGRLEGYYDQRITQRLILQPRAELNFAAQDVPENGIGSGLSNAELGLRLRYEIKREFAPYVGVSWERKFGATADFARAAGDRVQATSLVLGIRAWF